jgi:electron transfer flavoprotein beta subunit
MRVVVCVKEVSLLTGPVSIGRDQRLAPESLEPAVNAHDLFALEAALRLREAALVTEVVALTAGSGALEATVTWCAAMGVDRIVRLRAAAVDAMDAFGLGEVLAGAIKTLDASLVLCGQRSADSGSGVVPAAIAAALGVPYISAGARLQIQAARLTVERKLERGRRAVWQTSLPAVVACATGINVPRYVSVAAQIMARRAVPQEVSWDAAGSDVAAPRARATLRGLMPPRVRPKKTATPTLGMNTADKMRLIMSGGVTEKKDKKIIRGDADTLAHELMLFLDERQLLARRKVATDGQSDTV